MHRRFADRTCLHSECGYVPTTGAEVRGGIRAAQDVWRGVRARRDLQLHLPEVAAEEGGLDPENPRNPTGIAKPFKCAQVQNSAAEPDAGIPFHS